ncbi:glycosyltransferase family 4 protein [Kitasatospora mediocidica]|uniref:glycosyltransferase family 4 protein n=1 Tax=Kitasatospora mediocidica TaxID=58352 RepID=UPI0007C75D14|nr:glycosyltransferase family 4 protein [Kitasatospora mediocidica]
MVHWYVPHHNGGAEVMMHTMLRALVEKGHEVDVLESRPPLNESYRHAGYEIDGIRVHPYRDKDDPMDLMPGVGVVVTHLENTARAVILSRWMKIPCFVINHNDFDNTRSWSGETDVYQVYNSEWLREELQAYQPVPDSLVVRPPIYSDEYRTKPGTKVTLINLNEDKGAKVLYELARRMPETEFLGVVGAHGDQIIEDLPNVEIVKHTDPHSMREIYGRTRVLLMPSIYESWGRVAVEAMASGIPVIANPTNGLSEALGEAGTFVPRDDLNGWEGALRRLSDGRSWRAASKRAEKRSKELDSIRDQDLAAWCQAVENA